MQRWKTGGRYELTHLWIHHLLCSSAEILFSSAVRGGHVTYLLLICSDSHAHTCFFPLSGSTTCCFSRSSFFWARIRRTVVAQIQVAATDDYRYLYPPAVMVLSHCLRWCMCYFAEWHCLLTSNSSTSAKQPIFYVNCFEFLVQIVVLMCKFTHFYRWKTFPGFPTNLEFMWFTDSWPNFWSVICRIMWLHLFASACHPLLEQRVHVNCCKEEDRKDEVKTRLTSLKLFSFSFWLTSRKHPPSWNCVVMRLLLKPGD